MKKLENMGLTAKLIVAVILSSILTYLVIFGLGYSLTTRVIISQVNDIGENVVDTAVRRVDEVADAVARTTKSINFAIQNSLINENDIFQGIKFALSNNPELSGLSISFEPYVAYPKDKFYSPYCYLLNGKDVKCEMLGSKSYDYFDMDWYKKTKASNQHLGPTPISTLIAAISSSYRIPPPFIKMQRIKRFFKVSFPQTSLLLGCKTLYLKPRPVAEAMLS